jgi:hypothetical protein
LGCPFAHLGLASLLVVEGLGLEGKDPVAVVGLEGGEEVLDHAGWG